MHKFTLALKDTFVKRSRRLKAARKSRAFYTARVFSFDFVAFERAEATNTTKNENWMKSTKSAQGTGTATATGTERYGERAWASGSNLFVFGLWQRACRKTTTIKATTTTTTSCQRFSAFCLAALSSTGWRCQRACTESFLNLLLLLLLCSRSRSRCSTHSAARTA